MVRQDRLMAVRWLVKDVDELNPFRLEAGNSVVVLQVGTVGWYAEGIERKGSKNRIERTSGS